MASEKVEVIIPVAPVLQGAPRPPVARPQTFQGKVLGLLDTRKPNTDVFMDRIQERLLRADIGFRSVIRRRKPTIANEPTPPAIMAELAHGCDLVIHGVGD